MTHAAGKRPIEKWEQKNTRKRLLSIVSRMLCNTTITTDKHADAQYMLKYRIIQ